jgi:tRNA1(Val) A37 N6-methylase TrmN6
MEGGSRVRVATEDGFLGGRIVAVQPAEGHHRAGLEAVLLGSAVDARISGTVLDLGAGTGVAGMAVAARCPNATVRLVERDAEAAAFATVALSRRDNQAFARRVEVVTADIFDRRECEAVGLTPNTADAIVMNPPFHEPTAGTPPAARSRAGAYVLEAGLDPWLSVAAGLLKARGAIAVVFRADRLDALLLACVPRFGGIEVLPLAPREGQAASRVLLAARKGSRAPLRLLPPLALHPAEGNAYLPPAEAVLRHGAGLAEVHPAWTGIA